MELDLDGLDPDLDFEDPSEWDYELKECNYCKGTGIDRHVEADCLNCYGDGWV